MTYQASQAYLSGHAANCKLCGGYHKKQMSIDGTKVWIKCSNRGCSNQTKKYDAAQYSKALAKWNEENSGQTDLLSTLGHDDTYALHSGVSAQERERRAQKLNGKYNKLNKSIIRGR